MGFPSPIPFNPSSIGLNTILQKHLPKDSLTPANRELLHFAQTKHPDINFKSISSPWILKLNSSKDWFTIGKQGICPCLTTTCRHYIPKYERFLTGHEALALQGIPFDKYHFDFSDRCLIKFAGNTISVPILRLIIKEALKCINL